MIHEKIIKRADGSRVMIEVSLICDFLNYKYNFKVFYCEPRKRSFLALINRDDYSYSKLPPEEREKYCYDKYLNYVSEEEIHQAKTEIWEKLKP